MNALHVDSLNCNFGADPSTGDKTISTNCDFTSEISVGSNLKISGGNQVDDDEASLVKLTRVGQGRWFNMNEDNDKLELNYLYFNGGYFSEKCTGYRRECYDWCWGDCNCRDCPNNNVWRNFGLFIKGSGDHLRITLNHCVVSDMVSVGGIIYVQKEGQGEKMRGLQFTSSFTSFRRNKNENRLEYMTHQGDQGQWGIALFYFNSGFEDRWVTFDHSTFESNDAPGGGAILDIMLCTFRGADGSCTEANDHISKKFHMTNSVVESNIINWASIVRIQGGQDHIVRDTVFKNNKRTVLRNGVAVCVKCSDNGVELSGHALKFWDPKNILIERVVFDGNENLPGHTSAMGSALIVTNQGWARSVMGVASTTRVLNSTFRNNKALGSGAAIIVTSQGSSKTQKVLIDQLTSFIGNTDSNGPNNFFVFSPNSGSMEINFLQCAPGTYASLSGMGIDSSAITQGGTTPTRTVPWTSGCTNACPAGRFAATVAFRVDSDSCQACSAGKYCTASQATVETPCPAGMYCYNGGMGIVYPTPCAAGRYGDTVGLKTSQCSGDCPLGAMCVMQSTAPTPCTAGSYSDEFGSTNCKSCLAGFFSAANSSHCQPCEPGKIAKTIRSATCLSCEPGFFRAATNLPATSCYKCNKGKYSTSSAEVCDECEVGKFQEHEGQSVCQRCIRGTFANATGATLCIDCPSGYETGEIVNRSWCDQCSRGKWTNLKTGIDQCINCPVGTAGDGCVACTVGRHREFSTDPISCTACSVGRYNNDVGQASCLPCTPGLYQNLTQQSSCRPCSPGLYQKSKNASVCIGCPAGFDSETGSTKCLPCEVGRFSNSTGVSCQHCTVGKFRASGMDPKRCQKCPIGFSQSDEGQTSCTRCSPGEFNNITGAVECEPCAENTYYGDKGRNSTCIGCPAGWTSSEGSAKCQACGAGTYGAGCQFCIVGQYRGTKDPTDVCVDCPSGYYSDEIGQPFCLGCDAGRFAAANRTNECTQCQLGRYEDEKRSTGPCQMCPDGFQSNIKRTSCVVPPPDETIPTTELMAVVPSSERLAVSSMARRRSLNGKNRVDGFGVLLTLKIKKTPSGSPNIFGAADKLQVSLSKRPDFSRSKTVKLDQDEFQIVSKEDGAMVVSIHLSAIVEIDGEDDDESGDTVWHTQLYFKSRVLKGGTRGGVESIRNGPWETANKCSDSEYLSVYEGDGFDNDGTAAHTAPHVLFSATDTTVTTPKCTPCPNGGNCQGQKIFDEVNNLAGFQQLSWDPRAFGKCPYPASCPVGNSVVMKHHSSVTNGIYNQTTVLVPCLEGHTGNLCSQCVRGWTIPIGSENTACVKCPSSEANVASLAGLIFVGIVIVAFLVWDSLGGIKLIIASAERARQATNAEEARIASAQAQMPFHSVGIRIVSSYLQVAGLLTNFQVTLPPSVEALLVVESGASGIGGQVIAFSCLMPNTRGADLFFLKQLMSCLVIPTGLCVLIVLFWSVYGICCSQLVKKKTNNPNKATGNNVVTLRDKMQGSLVVLYYMMIPSILNSVTSMLQCTRYGEDDRSTNNLINYQIQPKVLLDAELSIVCYEKGHVQMVLSIALPGILLFLVLVPLTLLLSMRYHARKNELFAHNKNFNPRVSYRFGFLFLG
jgi:hypothetical protein